MFVREVDMAAPVARWLERVGGSCVGHEVTVGYGVADLVAGLGDEARLRNRRRQARPVAKSIQLAVLDFCTSFRTLDDLREWAPRGLSSLRREAIDPLIDQGLLVLAGSRYRTRVRPKDPFDELIAVELKLRDARRGIAQATAYRTFADRSYLALPRERVRTEALGAARQAGVRLLAVGSNTVEILVDAPTQSTSTPARRRIASERVLEASMDSSRLGGSQAPSLAV